MNPSTPPPPRTPPPSPPPGGPKGPTPTGPPRRVADGIYAVAEVCGFGDLKTPARRDPGCRPRASFVVATPGGPVTFTTPAPVGPPRFAAGVHRLVGRVEMGDGPPRPGQPGPPPRPQPGPTPHPPPPVIPQI